MTYDATTVLQKPSYTHAAMVDLILEQPDISQGEIARHFGYTEGWVSQIIRSDALRELMHSRKAELLDPSLAASISARFEALASRSLDILQDKLDGHPRAAGVSADVALKALDITSRALGYGAKMPGSQVSVNFVVAMPMKSVDSSSWVEGHAPLQLTADSHLG